MIGLNRHHTVNARSIRFLAPCVAVTLISSGCGGPLLTAQKFKPPTSQQVGQTLPGVPFSLNRPKVSIVRTPGTKGAPDTFAITTTYEPDPDQQYTLMISPALLSNVDWTMTFDNQGTLTDTNAKTTDQTASVVTAVGSIAAAVAPLFALEKKLPLDQAANPPPLPSKFVCPNPYPSQSESPSRPDLSIDKIDGALMSALSSPQQGLWDTLKLEWRQLPPSQLARYRSVWAQLLKRVLEADCAGRFDDFYYENAEELQLLQTALHAEFANNPPDSTQIGAVLDQFRPAFDLSGHPKPTAPKEAGPAVQEALWVRHELAKIRATSDTSELDDRKSALLQERQNLNILAANNIERDLHSERNVNRIDLCLTLDALNKWITDAEKLNLKLAAPKPANWVSQKVAELNKQIAAMQSRDRTPKGDALAPDPETVDRDLVALERIKAFILGVLPEYEKRSFLRKQLTAQRATSDTKALLAELDYVEKRLSAAEGAVSVPSSQPTPDAPVNAVPIVWFSTAQDIEQVLDNKWPGKSARPDYVVVYSPLDFEKKVVSKKATSGDDPAPCKVLEEIQFGAPPTAMNTSKSGEY